MNLLNLLNLHRFVLLTLLATCLSTLSTASRPATIPALQQWTDSTSVYTFRSTNRIIVDPAYTNQLLPVAQVFQSDLLALMNTSLAVLTTTACGLQAGDIYLSLSANDPSLGVEGYDLTIDSYITINAMQNAGAFYGTRTILQLLRVGSNLSGGTAKDYPMYRWRALHVDVGRKYFDITWLRNHVMDIAYLKMNLLHLHVADWSNFRLESSSHPEIVAAQHYSKLDMQGLFNLGLQYHVAVMVEFEMPGHANWIIAFHPELMLVSNTGQQFPDSLDLSNPGSFKIVSDLLKEWLPLIPGPFMHIGTDEYLWDYSVFPSYLTRAQQLLGPNANAKDLYFYFINQVDALIRTYNKTTWAWDDQKDGGSVLSTNIDIIMDSWTFAGPSEISQGYLVMDSSNTPLYLPWGQNWIPWSYSLYENWAPNEWSFGFPGVPPYTPGLLGAKIEMWFDNPNIDDYSVAEVVKNPLRSVSQGTWSSPKIVSDYNSFLGICASIGRAPGTTFPVFTLPFANAGGPYNGVINTPLQISSQGSRAYNTTIKSYYWDLGDGSISNLANPIHTYTAVGTYGIQLTLTDGNNRTGINLTQAVIGTSTPPPTIPPTAPPTTPPPTNPPVTTPPGTTNRALLKPIKASSQYIPGFTANLANDGNTSTAWGATQGGGGQWILVDMLALDKVFSSSVTFEKGAIGIWQYTVQASKDQVTWDLVVDRSANIAPAQTYNDAWVNTKGSYEFVRLNVTNPAMNHWAGIIEFQVFA